MKEILISEIEQRMLPYLNNEQLAHLQDALEYVLHGFEVHREQNEDKASVNAVMAFLSAKRVEGCSEKTLKYYQSTIEAMIVGIGKPPQQIMTDEIRQYLTGYQAERNASKVTIDNLRRSN